MEEVVVQLICHLEDTEVDVDIEGVLPRHKRMRCVYNTKDIRLRMNEFDGDCVTHLSFLSLVLYFVALSLLLSFLSTYM